MDEQTKINLKCLFCFSEKFELPDSNYQPQSGEMLKCANCGKLNDYDSMMRIVKRKGVEWAKSQAEDLIKKTLKKSGLFK